MGDKKFTEGDVIVSETSNGKFQPYKILKIETIPDGANTWHVLMYGSLDHMPTSDDVKNFSVTALHIPVASFEENAKLISHSEVLKEDLEGFFEYLRQTDFNRYIKESGEDVHKIIGEAQEYYKLGCKLASEKKYEEAIEAYSQTIDTFPFFLEAFDNRGFSKMDLGDYREAITDFKKSLEIEPTGIAAQFSIAECYFRLGEFQEAKKEIEKAIAIKDEKISRDLEQKILSKLG